LRETHKEGVWNINDIQTIYGTSVGSILGALIALKYDWETMDDYLIKRPWQNVYKFSMDSLFLAFQTKGILDKKIIEETFAPLFKAKDININVTLKEFYEITNIELHFFSTDINTFNLIDFSYKTHPEWIVTDAIYCSCSLPILFQPIIKDNICYCDGGFIANYPVKQCVENGANPDEIFGMSRNSIFNESNTITENSSLIDYILNLLYKTIDKVLNIKKDFNIKKEVFIKCPPLSIYDIYETTSSMEKRLELISNGYSKE
jgi:NTE family protein